MAHYFPSKSPPVLNCFRQRRDPVLQSRLQNVERLLHKVLGRMKPTEWEVLVEDARNRQAYNDFMSRRMPGSEKTGKEFMAEVAEDFYTEQQKERKIGNKENGCS